MKSNLPDLIPVSRFSSAKKQNKTVLKSTEPTKSTNSELIEKIKKYNNETDLNKIYCIDLRCHKLQIVPLLSEFKNVRTLDLSSNEIQKLDNVNQFKDLRELKIYDNKIENLNALNGMKEIIILQAQFNIIKVIDVNNFKTMRKIKQIRLDSNCLSNLKFDDFSSCVFLTYLDLSFNQLESISFVTSLLNIEELYVSKNRIKSIPNLMRCKKLSELKIDNNDLVSLSGLKDHPSLMSLDISNNQITQLTDLGVLRYLEYGNFSFNLLENQSISPLATVLPNIEILDLSNNKLDDIQKILDKLVKCKNLLELVLTNNRFPIIYDETQAQYSHTEIGSQIPQLQMLDHMTIHYTHSNVPPKHSGCLPMRPMSAASGLSIKQMENQFKSIFEESRLTFNRQKDHYDRIINRLNEFANENLPSPKQQRILTSREENLCQRSIVRSRLDEALQFGNTNYESDEI